MKITLGRLLASIFFLALWSATAIADVIRIQSGEHSDFTRLVFYTQDIKDHQISRQDGGFEFYLESSFDTFDTSAIFDFIPRSRILNVEATEGGRLFVYSSCACSTRVFLVDGNTIAVDIFDDDGARVTATETRFVDFQVDASAFRFPLSATGLADGSFTREESDASSPTDELLALLVEEIATLAPSDLEVETFRENFPPIDARGSRGPVRALGVRLDTGQIRDRENTDDCSNGDAFLVADWIDMAHPTRRLAEIRSSVDVGNDLLEENTLDLAEAYAALGFGVEAISALGMVSNESVRANAIFDVAQAVDQPFHGLTPRVRSQLHCDNPGALWSFLALGPRAQLPDDTNLQAVSQAFPDLPANLRAHLGPVIEQRLAAMGEIDGAALVRAAYRHAKLSVMTVEGASDGPATTEGGLVHAAERNAAVREGREIGSLLIDRGDRGRALEMAEKERVEAFLHGTKGAEVSSEILALYVETLVASGEFAYAIDFFERFGRSAFLEDRDAVNGAGIIAGAIADVVDPSDFLLLSEQLMQSDLAPRVSDDMRDTFALRLLRLGVPDLAPALSLAPRPGTELEAMFKASEALAVGNFEEAIARVSSVPDAAARVITAEALMGLEEHEAAAGIFLDLGDTGRAGEAFWMARNWPEAAEYLPSSPRRTWAEALASETVQDGSVTGGLPAEPPDATGAELLRQAQDALSAVAALREDLRPVLDAAGQAE